MEKRVGAGVVMGSTSDYSMMAEAHEKALADVACIECDNLFHRTDIGHRVLKAGK